MLTSTHWRRTTLQVPQLFLAQPHSNQKTVTIRYLYQRPCKNEPRLKIWHVGRKIAANSPNLAWNPSPYYTMVSAPASAPSSELKAFPWACLVHVTDYDKGIFNSSTAAKAPEDIRASINSLDLY